MYIGVMSGTSIDGVDAVLVSISEKGIKLIASVSHDFPDNLAEELKELLRSDKIVLQKVGELDHRLGIVYAESINQLILEAGVDRKDVIAIGCHGQTVFHNPRGKYPFTMQLGDGNLIAANTGITTVTDFRRMDMAFGGEGAPLTPAFHKEFFSSDSENRVILNLGGIANISILNKDKFVGMDTGPANCLMDLWIQKCLDKKYDCNGSWAKSGRVCNGLLESFLKEDYFGLVAPKSTGKELFNMNWIEDHLTNFSKISEQDVQATLCELTARTIVDAINLYSPDYTSIYVCGGGAFNTFLLERLGAFAPGVEINTTAKLNVHEQLVEAMAFAWLAKQRVLECEGNLPEVTGARSKVVLGSLYKSNGIKDISL